MDFTVLVLYIHPLSKVPGPKIAAFTSLWLAYHTYIGDECTVVFNLHRKYGSVLRVGPNEVDISNADAIEPIYITRGGFPKSSAYSKFDIDGHNTIFSTLTLAERATRAKSVAPLFSRASLRQSEPLLSQVSNDFAVKIRNELRTGKPVDVLNLSRCMAIDSVTAYLFQNRYGALGENLKSLSASPFVDAFVGVGALFNMVPGKISNFFMAIHGNIMSSEGSVKAFGMIDRFTSNLIRTAVPKSGSYQSRLLEKQTSAQSRIEVKDICFAGTDSTAMNTASIIWYLTKYPEIYDKLHEEVQNAVSKGDDPTKCPYLRATVKEGLRLSWTNPIRLPRTVPAMGWSYRDYYFPAGTNVGISAFQLHQDEAVFPDPLRFSPERWLLPTQNMLDHFFAFGKGTRSCIAQSLGTLEVTMGVCKVVEQDLLRGARIFGDENIKIKQWFNSRVEGKGIMIQFKLNHD
ncbi:uncharacterized protein N7483_009310 [Penicillium malachiteum]|uniref:uncharacterized protein n=1 Tax=Penicillium malachiteum TaxID=1324776 RepID=UPI002548E47E|nr:uncharacterized protein N7483_009310 [Penicillium malachiteum]KAJ5721376.1 hypothetical protein N7483_009310 [Penicillium malachiteum]